jgi:hypothetical protein
MNEQNYKKILTYIGIGIVIGFLPSIYIKNQLSYRINDLSEAITSSTVNSEIRIERLEAIIYFHASCNSGNKESCVTLDTILKGNTELKNIHVTPTGQIRDLIEP